MSSQDLVYKIALGILPGIGDINARKLVAYCGSAEAVFRESSRSLVAIPGIGKTLAQSITSGNAVERAEKEVAFIDKYDIRTSFYLDDNYPRRLRECPDSPVIFFYKGTLHEDAPKVLSIVGTRNATRKGKDICNEIIARLAEKHQGLVIVSGLAYGVDICAHKSAIKNRLPTLGVMAHGFKTIYPSSHANVAREMLQMGALVTDFLSDAAPDRNNFLKRNRIIAGLSDATLIIESGTKGGAMVTADIAMSYNRDVLAVPGYPNAKYSSGCNMLIKSQKASLIESDTDIEFFLNWLPEKESQPVQSELPLDLSLLETEIVTFLKQNNKASADLLSTSLGKPIHHLSSALLRLEFTGIISALPGNIYSLK